jgi:hypothetical protein
VLGVVVVFVVVVIVVGFCKIFVASGGMFAVLFEFVGGIFGILVVVLALVFSRGV